MHSPHENDAVAAFTLIGDRVLIQDDDDHFHPDSAMRLTREGDYAVRVMMDLAAHAIDGPVPRASIQARQDVPPAYLAKIVQTLARAGLVRTQPGARGGVSLNASPETITVRRVIEAVEGPIALNRCVTNPSGCARDSFCPAHPVWLRVQALVTRELDAVTIASLAVPRGRACLLPAVGRARRAEQQT